MYVHAVTNYCITQFIVMPLHEPCSKDLYMVSVSILYIEGVVVRAVIHSGLMPDACVVVGLSVLACAYSIRVPTVQCIHTYG